MSRRVLYLDPYHTASHRTLARGLAAGSSHRVTLMTLPARKWKWRMRGAALAFEPRLASLPQAPEVIVTTDFMNVPELLGLTRHLWPRPVPVILYFHENQLTYPSSSADIRDIHFGLVNIHSALAADRVLFNSEFHRREVLAAAEALLERMPDFRPEGVADRILERSEVLGIPLDLDEMDRALERQGDGGPPPSRPLVVWNHRWEEDRNPEAFFRAMEELDGMARRGEAPDFGLAVAGQTYQSRPAVFEEARSSLGHRIDHWGHVGSRAEYLELLGRSSLAVSTSRHEFFGVSVLEAIYMGCAPLLPRRLTYPEIALGRPELLYDDPAEIAPKAAALLSAAADTDLEDLREAIRRHESSRIVARWDDLIHDLAGSFDKEVPCP